MITLALSFCTLVLFHNCAPVASSKNISSEMQAIQSAFPSIKAIEPIENVTYQENKLQCYGDCKITFNESPTLSFPNITCGGDLFISSDQLHCTENLALSR